VVVLPSKCEALISNFNTEKEKEKESSFNSLDKVGSHYTTPQ
jgi:hypothetical protein